jgi:hypothetical protein
VPRRKRDRAPAASTEPVGGDLPRRGLGDERMKREEPSDGARQARRAAPAGASRPQPATPRAEPAGVAPPQPWWQQYRILLLVYAIGIAVGVREHVLSRGRDEFGWLTPEGRELIGVIAQVNPDDPDTDFLEGMEALAGGDEREFFRRVDRALGANIRHNELFLRLYAQYLINSSADPDEVNAALNRWRENFPYSRETVSLQVGTAGESERAVIERALASIPWVADAHLIDFGEGSDARTVAQLMFRRGRTVNIRDAMAVIGDLS